MQVPGAPPSVHPGCHAQASPYFASVVEIPTPRTSPICSGARSEREIMHVPTKPNRREAVRLSGRQRRLRNMPTCLPRRIRRKQDARAHRGRPPPETRGAPALRRLSRRKIMAFSKLRCRVACERREIGGELGAALLRQQQGRRIGERARMRRIILHYRLQLLEV